MIGDRWGVQADEIERRYPCDTVIASPALQAWRAVTVRATPAQVWPWIAQLRLAPYSYDWIDNLGRRSPQELQELAEPQVGDHFTATAGRPMGQILSVSPKDQLTGRIMGAVMSYVLVAEGDTTRLLLKIVMPGPRWAAPLISVGDLIMARRQLLNIKHLAEQTASVPRS